MDRQRLEKHSPELYLHRFIAAIAAHRGNNERYVFMRGSDTVAVEAARDGSMELLEKVTVLQSFDESDTEPEPSD